MVIKSRTMRWGGHIARVCEIENPYKILVVIPKGKNSSED